MPHRIFVETNILLNPNFKFSNYEFVKTSIITVEELDDLKDNPKKGYKARDATNKLRKATNVQIVLDYDFSFENRFLKHKNDNFILGFAYQVWKDNNEFVFLTDDFNLWLKAKAVGIPCELFGFKEEDLTEKYNGIREVWLNEKEYKNLIESEDNFLNLCVNEYLIINNTTKNEQYLYIWNDTYFEEVKKVKPIINKYLNKKDAVVPLDIYQRAFIHMLQNDNVKVMITDSVYGAGKSYLMLHWALQQLDSGYKYNKMYFIKSDSPPDGRPRYPAIPGGIFEKSEGLLGILCDTTSEENLNDFSSRNSKVEVLPIQFAKSRSLRKSILFITECQDFTPSEIERLLSRIGEDTVVLLDGSTKQIDNKHCIYRNGLTVASENFKNKAIAAQVNLVEDFRSDISKMVSEMDWHD